MSTVNVDARWFWGPAVQYARVAIVPAVSVWWRHLLMDDAWMLSKAWPRYIQLPIQLGRTDCTSGHWNNGYISGRKGMVFKDGDLPKIHIAIL